MTDYDWFEAYRKEKAETERLRAALEEIRDEHAEYDDLAYNIAIRALKDKPKGGKP